MYGRILAGAMLIAALTLAAGLIRAWLQKDEANKRKTMRGCIWALFILYLLYLFVLLFVNGRAMQNPFAVTGEQYRRYLQTRTNFIPFKSIAAYGKVLLRQTYAIVNIFGNLFAFAPMGFFLPVLFQKMRSPGRFSLLAALSVICVELLQAATLTGACDIDDVILNTLGAVMIFMLVQTKLIQKTLARRHIL
jgi:glycopeptide antibiotics resistance protein